MSTKLTWKEKCEQLRLTLASTWRQIIKEEIEKACKDLEVIMYRHIEERKYDLEYAELDLHRAKYDVLKKILERPEEIEKILSSFILANEP